MGAEMATMVLPLPHDREIDWEAAARAIRDVRLAVLWDAEDLYPWERWLAEADNLPGAEAAFVALRTAQVELYGYARTLRAALEHGWPAELVVLDTPTRRLWVTGGPSWGDAPGELFDSALLLAEAGITGAAGFDGYTAYVNRPISRRTLRFDPDGRRLVRFGVAAAHAAEQAAGTAPFSSTPRWRQRFDAWVSELDGLADTDEAAEYGLLRFASYALTLTAWLDDPRAPITAKRLDARARDLALLADEGALDERPHRRSGSAALRECRRLAEDIGGWFDVLDEPPHEHDDDARAFAASWGGTLGHAVGVELSAHALLAAVAALADLRGDEVAALLDPPPEAVTAKRPPRSRRKGSSLSENLALIVVDEVDWDAGELALQALDPSQRDERRADLIELEHLVDGVDYVRFATSERVGTDACFIAAPHFTGGPDVAVSISRLGRDGILDAIGVAAWSAPDPSCYAFEQSSVPRSHSQDR